MTSVPLKTGALSPEQLSLMLTTLPFDIAFVDETDTRPSFIRKPRSASSAAHPPLSGARCKNATRLPAWTRSSA